MAFVRVEQRSAHLATPVRVSTVASRNGPMSKATFTAISNAWRGSGDTREEEATAIQWTLWGKAADNAAQYLSRGSHVNVSGRVQNNNYERNGTMVYGMAFTAEQVDYLDDRSTSQALRERQAAQEGGDPDGADAAEASAGSASGAAPQAVQRKAPTRGRKAASAAAGSGRGAARGSLAAAGVDDDDIPF